MRKETKVQMYLKEIENKILMAKSPISLGFPVMENKEDIAGLAEEIIISAQKMKEVLTSAEAESKNAFATSEKIKAGLSQNCNNQLEKSEYRTMDDSIKSFVEMEQKIKERNANLANQITQYVQEHGMSWEELMQSLLFVKQAFTSGATLRKMDEEE